MITITIKVIEQYTRVICVGKCDFLLSRAKNTLLKRKENQFLKRLFDLSSPRKWPCDN